MKKFNIFCFASLLLLLVGCNKENPFSAITNEEEGQLLKSAIGVDLKVDDVVRKKIGTRADVSVNDFTVIFTKVGSDVPVKTFKYGEMPDVVTLAAGDYICTATYGENRIADWENPYFKGVSEEFHINPYEITSYISPIVCRLENIKVTIEFDASLKSCMYADSYVAVKVNSSNELNYTLEIAEAGQAGYFMHNDESTLVATFNGKVDGVQISESKSLTGVTKGNHYKITFKKHADGGTSGGDSDADIQVDASVTVVDVERNIEREEEELLDDSERPSEGDDDPGEDPGDDPTPKLPTIEGKNGLNLDIVHDGNSMTECELKIMSYAEGGITDLVCDIESDRLTPDELQGVGLSQHLDLGKTPSEYNEILVNLGFPTNVAGRKEVDFSITGFLTLMGALGDGEHHFVITVTDANGTTTKTLKIKY